MSIASRSPGPRRKSHRGDHPRSKASPDEHLNTVFGDTAQVVLARWRQAFDLRWTATEPGGLANTKLARKARHWKNFVKSRARLGTKAETLSMPTSMAISANVMGRARPHSKKGPRRSYPVYLATPTTTNGPLTTPSCNCRKRSIPKAIDRHRTRASSAHFITRISPNAGRALRTPRVSTTCCMIAHDLRPEDRLKGGNRHVHLSHHPFFFFLGTNCRRPQTSPSPKDPLRSKTHRWPEIRNGSPEPSLRSFFRSCRPRAGPRHLL